MHPHPQLGVEDQDAIVDRVEHDLALPQPLLLDLDRGVAKDPQRLGHPADFVAAGGGQRCPEITACDPPHAEGQRLEPAYQVAVDIEPHDQHRAQQTRQHDRGQHPGADLANGARFAAGSGNVRLRGSNEPVDRFSEPAGKGRVLGQEAFTAAKRGKLALPCGGQASRTLGEGSQLLYTAQETVTKRGVEVGRESLERTQRACERERQEWQVCRRRRVGSLEEVVVHRCNFELRLLQRDRAGDRPGEVLARTAAGCSGAPPGCKLCIQHENARRHQALGADDSGREPAQKRLLHPGDREPVGNQSIKRLKVMAKTCHRRLDGTECGRVRGRVPQSGQKRLQAGKLGADASGYLGASALTRCSKECWCCGHDPLGLTGEFQRGKRCRRPLGRGPLDYPAKLHEGPHGGRGGEQGEGADAEKSEQQTPADAERGGDRCPFHVVASPRQRKTGRSPLPFTATVPSGTVSR